MSRFVEEQDRRQCFLLPASLDDFVVLGFAGATPAHTERPAYHPSTMLKVYLYGYLNRIQSSRRLEA